MTLDKDHVCTLRTEYRGSSPCYTVYDHLDCVVIWTTNRSLAECYFDLCVRGHTARTLHILMDRGQWPRCRMAYDLPKTVDKRRV